MVFVVVVVVVSLQCLLSNDEMIGLGCVCFPVVLSQNSTKLMA